MITSDLKYRTVELVFSRLKEKYPKVHVLKRPGNRPFAGISTHHPAGNVFDLSQREWKTARTCMSTKTSKDRVVSAILDCASWSRTIGEFYRNVFDLIELEKPGGDPNHYLSDGKVTLAVMPWQITDFLGSGIERPALYHIGFKVESMAAFKADWDTYSMTDWTKIPSAK